MRKRLILALLCCVWTSTLPAQPPPSSVPPEDQWSDSPTRNLMKMTKRKTGQAIGSVGNVLGNVTETITQPITDPKAAVSRWFDYNPEIESGKKTNFNILPLFVSSPERGQGFGVKYAQESIWKKEDVIRAHALQTLKGKSEYRLKYELPPEFFTNLGGEAEIGYENYERFYYGIGNMLPEDNKSQYDMELFEAKLPLLYQIREFIFGGIALNFENWKVTRVGEKGILRSDLPKLVGTDRSRLYSTTLLLRWDSRDSKTDPANGTFLEAGQEYIKKLYGSETDFTRTTVESRIFYPILGKKSHVLAIKLFSDYTAGDVPFYHLPALGGVFFNRGLIEGRYRDNLALCGNLEYRLKIYERLHWAFFIDAGNVFHDFKFITMNRAKVTGGTGMRYYVPPGDLLLARVDGGYSTEGFLIYLTFDHPF